MEGKQGQWLQGHLWPSDIGENDWPSKNNFKFMSESTETQDNDSQKQGEHIDVS